VPGAVVVKLVKAKKSSSSSSIVVDRRSWVVVVDRRSYIVDVVEEKSEEDFPPTEKELGVVDVSVVITKLCLEPCRR
jgi:hypothetical protein